MSQTDTPARSKLPRNVVALGWVSLLTDAAADIVYPLLPAFLMSLGGGAITLGWLEGVSETVGALTKLAAGRVADVGPRRKPLIFFGYAIAAIARPFFSIVSTPAGAVVVRAVDRIGKGLRGPPRDAMLSQAVSPAERGHAFGFHRMMDNFGGVIGPVLGFLLLKWFDMPLRHVFIASLIPGLLSALVVLFFIRPETLRNKPQTGLRSPHHHSRRVPSGDFRRYLVACALFSLAESGDIFLLHHLVELGLDVTYLPLAWVSLQLLKGLLNVPGGRLADRRGHRSVVSMGWALYGLVYFLLGLVRSWGAAWLLFVPYALHYGLSEAGRRALVSEFTDESMRGRAYGLQLAIEGLCVLPANVLFGMAYDRYGPLSAFSAAALLAMLASGVLRFAIPRRVVSLAP